MRVVVAIGVTLALGLLLTVLAAWRYSRDQHRLFEQELSAIRAQGLPVTAQELETYYYDTDSEAAARGLAFVRLFDAYDDTLETLDETSYWDRVPLPGEGYSEDDVEHARLHLSRNGTYMGELNTLLSQDVDVRYPMNLVDGFQVQFPHLAQVRNALRMLLLQSFVASVDEDQPLLAQSLNNALAMSDRLRNEPYIISQLVRIACVGIAWTQAQHALNASSLDVDSLSHLQRTVESLNLRGAIVAGAIGERCMYYDSAELFIGSTPILSWFSPANYEMEGPFQFIWAEVSAIGQYLSFSELTKLGESEPWKRKVLATDHIEAATGGWSPLHYFENISLAPVGRAYSAEDRGLAHLATYRAALAVLRFCGDQDHRPKNLAELVPIYLDDVPVDPFDGQPVRYVKKGSGFAVYSLGHDLDDDVGSPPHDKAGILEDGDIAFQVFDVTPYQAESNSRN